MNRNLNKSSFKGGKNSGYLRIRQQDLRNHGWCRRLYANCLFDTLWCAQFLDQYQCVPHTGRLLVPFCSHMRVSSVQSLSINVQNNKARMMLCLRRSADVISSNIIRRNALQLMQYLQSYTITDYHHFTL